MKTDLLPTTQEGRLDRIVEECAEVIQAICKGRRFGWDVHQYDGVTYDNRAELDTELRDLVHAIGELRAYKSPQPQPGEY